MIKENEPTPKNNRYNSYGELKLPKIERNFSNTLPFSTDKPHNSNKRKIKLNIPIKKIKTQRKINVNTLKTDMELVKSLDLDLKVEQIVSREFDALKQKELIDQNIDIQLKRLGKYKQNLRDDIRNEVESKEKVKLLEKEFNNDLNEYNVIKNENVKLNEHILNLINIIDDYKMELYTLDKYRKDFFKQFLVKEEKEKMEIIEKIEKNLYKDKEEYEMLQKELKKYEYDKNMKFQNEILLKQENIKENINRTKELLNDLQEQKNSLKEERKEIKNKINENKKYLIKLYHLSLYEGLDFRYEGLSNVIRAIWNMGVEVDIKYMPNYLDKLLIDFLFNHAKVYLQIINFKKQIEISQEKFLKDLNEWKNMNDYNFKNENSSMSSISDVNLFETRLKDKEKYHKSRKFMKNYYNKYSHLIDNKEINELNEYKKSLSSEKKIPLPKKFLDEKQNIEKGKYILQNLQKQMKDLEKNEIKRICREFSFNNYGEAYKVCPYVVVSAICGDECKDEGMMLFNMTEKEIAENKKLIKFFIPKK